MKRIFAIETMGGYWRYLTTVFCLAAGADAAYVYEEMFIIKDLQCDFDILTGKIREGVREGCYSTFRRRRKEKFLDEFKHLRTLAAERNSIAFWQKPRVENDSSDSWMDGRAGQDKLGRPLQVISNNNDSACIRLLQQREREFLPLKVSHARLISSKLVKFALLKTKNYFLSWPTSNAENLMVGSL